MTGRTHFACGALAGALAGRLTGCPVAGAAIGAVSALLPDIDHPGSEVGRYMRPIAVILEAVAGHRTVTHTVWFCLFVGFIFWLLSLFLAPFIPAVVTTLHSSIALPPPWEIGVLALLGSLSHLVLDACTRSGVRPLEPANSYHISGPLTTGDPLTEWPACLLFTAAALKLLNLV